MAARSVAIAVVIFVASAAIAAGIFWNEQAWNSGQETYSSSIPPSSSSQSSYEVSTSSTVSTTNSTTYSISQTSQTWSSTTPPQGGLTMFVNSTIMDRAQSVMQCGQEAGCGYIIYIFNITVANTGLQADGFNDFDLRLQTNTSSLYGTYAYVYAIESPANGRPHPMQSPVDLAPGQRVSGEEGFQIPLSESPTELIYPDPVTGANITADIPAPTSWVTEVVTDGDVSIAPSDLACPSSSQGACFTAQYEGLNDSYLGSADYFTGEKMAFQVTVNLGGGQAVLLGVKITSSVAGFELQGFTPFDCTGGTSDSCTAWTFDVYYTVQPGLSYWGSPALTVLLTDT